MKLKYFLHDYFILPINKLFIKNKNYPDSVIVRVDGGISSQICFYLIGKYFMDRGFNVKFDIKWFNDFGMDMNNKFERNFDFKSAFPSLPFNIATDEEINFYRKYYRLDNKKYKNHKAPLYLGNYYYYNDLIHKYRQLLIDNFNPNLDETTYSWLIKIKSQPSCAIHVKRGDLSQVNGFYGTPATPEYFLKAIEFIKNKDSSIKFFFFSDEIDWIKSEIVPYLQNINYEIVNCNGSNKGYLDLYLMSKCNNYITSIGSFGKFARILNSSDNAITTICKTDKNICSLDKLGEITYI